MSYTIILFPILLLVASFTLFSLSHTEVPPAVGVFLAFGAIITGISGILFLGYALGKFL